MRIRIGGAVIQPYDTQRTIRHAKKWSDVQIALTKAQAAALATPAIPLRSGSCWGKSIATDPATVG